MQYLSSRRIQGTSAETKPTNVPNNTEFFETNTGDIYTISGGTWTLKNSATGGGGGSGSGSVKSGSTTKSGNSSTKIFTIAHSFGATPASALVIPSSTDAMGSFITDVDGTNITITYSVAPPTGTNNLEYFWLVSAADIVNGGGGGGSGAPTDATYVTLTTSTGLTAERTLAAGSGLSLSDGGANNAATLAIDTAVTANLTSAQTLQSKTFNGIKYVRSTKTASTYTVTATDHTLLADCTSNNITFNLPAVSGTDGAEYYIQKIDSSANTLTIDGNGAETINGAATLVLNSQYQGVILRSKNDAWITFPSVNEKVGKATANGNASTTVFNIAHGMGTTPTYAFISVAQSGSAFIGYQYTVSSTNIVVTFASAPASGTGNIIIYWRAIL